MAIIFLIVCCFVILDFVLGIGVAIKKHNLLSKKMREGLLRKAANITVPLLGLLLDEANVYLKLGLPVNLLSISAAYVVLMETISILENVHQLNEKLVPKEITKFLGIVTDK